MSVIKITIKDKPFVCLSKDCLERIDLSWGARGLHSFLISKPANWQIKISHLIKCSPQGKDAIYKLLNELVNAGYIERAQERDKLTQKFKGYDYIVYEEPKQKQADNAVSGKSGYGSSPMTENTSTIQAKIEHSSEHPQMEFPCPENPYPAFPYPANPPLINIDINNNILNKNKAAARAREQTEELPTNSVEIAAAALSDIDLQITNQLTAKQTEHVEQLVQQRYRALKQNQTFQPLNVETIVHAVEAELINPRSFKKAHPNFIHKLNAILAEAMKGNWNPEISTKKQIPTSNKVDYKLRALEIKMQCVERERQGFILDLTRKEKNNPTAIELIQSYRVSIAKHDKELEQLRKNYFNLQKPLRASNEVERFDNHFNHVSMEK